ncbi:MAG: ATP-binding protein [Candidatus Kapaibacteriota bacterium]|jgi:two-component system sensor kinase FixL
MPEELQNLDSNQDILIYKNIINDLEKKVNSLEQERDSLLSNLNEVESLQKSIIDNSLDGTMIIDINFNILFVNDVIIDILGYNELELIGQDFRTFISPVNLVKVEDFYSNVLEHDLNLNKIEFDIVNNKGINRNVFVSISKTSDFRGRSAFISQILDITEIKDAERKVRDLNQELEKRVIDRTIQLEEALGELKIEVAIRQRTENELQEAKEKVTKALEQEKELNFLKSRFISMISHEYRTPLTVILTSTYLIEQYYQGTNREQFDKFIFKIRESVKSMIKLLEDVLTIGKSESGKFSLSIDKIRLVDFCNDIIEEVQVIDNKKHIFEFNYVNNDFEVISDVNSLKHIISNLLLNAAKYSPGQDNVIINLEDLNNDVKMEVIDFGIGIPIEDQSLLFEAFYRASNVGAISGTGLGLSIVKRFVDTIKGTITVDSKRNEGTKFTIIFPKDIHKDSTT